MLDVRLKAKRCLQAKWHSLKALLLCSSRKLGEILACRRHQLLRALIRDPAIGLRITRIAVRCIHADLRAGPARDDNAPGISGWIGIMHDDRRRRALPRRFLIFIGPAAIIGHGAPAERAFQVLCFIVRIIDEDDDCLPLHVHALVIVPALLRRVDSIADEDNIAVLDLRLRHDAITVNDQICFIGKVERCLAAADLQAGCRIGCHPHHRHVLKPAALVGGLEPGSREATGDIPNRLVLARCRRRAAFKGVRRQRLGDFLQRVDGDVGVCGVEDGGRE